jgi:tetratricopeptide (TPR) repeat protein
MRIKIFLLSFFILPGSMLWACLNEDHISKHGRSFEDSTGWSMSFHKGHNKAEIEDYLKQLLGEKPVTEDEKRENRNSIAVSYIKLGRLDEAEAILNELLKKYPTNYSVVINLGTLYELQGKNSQALTYIKKGIALKPDSHWGSEWFHVKVLEFKLKNVPVDKIPGSNILDLRSVKGTSDQIAAQVGYQLEERIPFTPAPDMMMAKMLQEYGDFLADSLSIKNAYIIYEIGMDYDREGVLQLSAKRDALKPYFKKYGETIPVTGKYYLDNIISAIEEKGGETFMSLLEKGVDRIQDEIKEREERRKRKLYIVIGAVILLSIGGYVLYRRAKRKGEYS